MQTDGDDYAHLHLGSSTGGGDVVLCGVRDISGDTDLNLYEFLSGAVNVTITFERLAEDIG